MDIRMPELDGIKATSEIVRTRGLEQVRVLILTTYDTDAYVFETLQAGASGFLLKDAGPAELLHAIRVIAAGEALLAPRGSPDASSPSSPPNASPPRSRRTGWPC